METQELFKGISDPEYGDRHTCCSSENCGHFWKTCWGGVFFACLFFFFVCFWCLFFVSFVGFWGVFKVYSRHLLHHHVYRAGYQSWNESRTELKAPSTCQETSFICLLLWSSLPISPLWMWNNVSGANLFPQAFGRRRLQHFIKCNLRGDRCLTNICNNIIDAVNSIRTYTVYHWRDGQRRMVWNPKMANAGSCPERRITSCTSTGWGMTCWKAGL